MGHGFKFTILLGKIIAMFAIGDEKYKQDLSRFQIDSIKCDLVRLLAEFLLFNKI